MIQGSNIPWFILWFVLSFYNISAMLRITSSRGKFMYSRKSVGPRMEPWGTPALTGNSYKDLPSKSTRILLLLRIEKERINIWPQIPEGLSLWRRPAYQTLSKALDIFKCYSSSIVAQGLLTVVTKILLLWFIEEL